MADPDFKALLSELQEIKHQLKELAELFASFSNDGLPLRAQVPTSELLASVVTAAALISKDAARMSQDDLNRRIQMAQVLSTELIRCSDSYQRDTQRRQLESLTGG